MSFIHIYINTLLYQSYVDSFPILINTAQVMENVTGMFAHWCTHSRDKDRQNNV